MCPTFPLFGLNVPLFGTMMLVGMLAAFLLILNNRKNIPYCDDDILSMALTAIISGFIGSKLLYWIVEFDQILADPHFLLESLTAGFVFYGALITGVLSVFVFAWKKKQSFFAYADLALPAFCIGQGFGRIGCFLAGCCYGAPTDSALGVIYPVGSAAPAGVPLLPTQLFEAAFCILFALALSFVFFREKKYGTVAGIYMIGYGVWRFIIEFFRSDDRGAVGALSTSQFIGIFVVLVGIALLVLVKLGKTSDRVSRETLAEEVEEAAAETAEEETAEEAAETPVEEETKEEA